VRVEVAVPAVGRWTVRGAMALLVMGVTYNFPLAILNARGVPIARNTVIGVEAVLMAAGLILALSHWRAEMTRWLLMIVAFFALSLILSQFRQTFDLKSFRDMLMFAVFIMNGMLVPWRDARRVIVGLHVAILLVMLIEVFFPAQFGAFVDPRSYFIATRGFTSEQLAGDSNLFSAVRPDERYLLPWLGWNRASSLFLEPLSLGNYVSFAVLAMLMFWRDWSFRMRLFMVVSTGIILVGCDGRFAGVSAIVLVLFAPLLRRLPAVLAIFYLPAAVLVGRIASQVMQWRPVNDDFSGRVARGMKQLFKLDWYDLWGFSIPTPALADSGIAYLVMSQSLAGVVMLQMFLYLQPEMRRPEQRLYLHGTALTFALSILVSISMLSIKTAGFYWFLMGVVMVMTPREDARRAWRPAGQGSSG
jgi:putative polymerase